ncbi:Phosphate regulon transcriptional regulatory protein PhoB (SphR) [Halanaerobium saccharolyticum subsp. saccharolyticum DSM 6643]|uniref:Stage 0 sporulation protein A homolog n=1 Tax=Halanaerobium saccharolyticum subsp. saccharolyticum DSM 6643 TaxID=1293054 RepID=M5DZK1_9FIRM|nr:response regulator transcription factor [Halanaerobium saccharolyticum]CCU78632.1 Phosphate regulon transcriptional regulatory protein PhoB (SphR) [Halanaerobium saccharolyticum subsp. saccharolyticum DSM 6643]
MEQILMVEDEKELARVTKDYFGSRGYLLKVINDGQEALDYLSLNLDSVKLLILDIMLPGVDGLTICEKVRQQSNIPIIILSARTGEEVRITGIELGADDYLEKPYSIKELFVRVKSQLRRAYELQLKLSKIRAANIVLDLGGRQLYLDDQPVNLAVKEFELLKILIQNKGRVVNKDKLFNQVWGIDSDSDFSTLTVHINKLREKIEKNPKKPELIKTVWGIGYRFEAES